MNHHLLITFDIDGAGLGSPGRCGCCRSADDDVGFEDIREHVLQAIWNYTKDGRHRIERFETTSLSEKEVELVRHLREVKK